MIYPQCDKLLATNKFNDQTMTNLQTPSRAWGKQRASLKAMFPDLHDKDFLYEYGGKEEMMNKLQIKIGKTRSELMELITETKASKKYYK
jgi:hypothetical protein